MILALETATTAASAALVANGVVVAEAAVAQTRRHTEVLMGLIDEVLDAAHVQLSDLSAIACDIGPGLFTGLRVGVAMAQGFGVAGQLSVIPVTSLFALATVAVGPRAALVDARRGEVFVQLFDGEALEPVPTTGPLVVAPERLVDLISPSRVICGDGGTVAQEILTGAGRTFASGSPIPHAGAVGLLAEQLPTSSWLPPSQLRPLYLRDADAKVNFIVRNDPSTP